MDRLKFLNDDEIKAMHEATLRLFAELSGTHSSTDTPP